MFTGPGSAPKAPVVILRILRGRVPSGAGLLPPDFVVIIAPKAGVSPVDPRLLMVTVAVRRRFPRGVAGGPEVPPVFWRLAGLVRPWLLLGPAIL